MAGNIFIGTSGWRHLHWRGSIYPEGLERDGWLAHYAGCFNSVEIIDGFHDLPDASLLQEWCGQVPEGFRFAARAPHLITQRNRLRNCDAALDAFVSRFKHLGTKLGPILFQLPDEWQMNRQRLEAFLHTLPGNSRYAFELPDPSWHNEEVYRLLREHNVAFCIFDRGGESSPLEATADFVYLRLCGPGNNPHAGRYSLPALRTWSGRVKRWAEREGRDVYLFFDNDESGYAAKNAAQLAGWFPDSLPAEVGEED